MAAAQLVINDRMLRAAAMFGRGVSVEKIAAKMRLEAAVVGRDLVALGLACGECGGTGVLANDGPRSACDDCGGTGRAAPFAV